MEKTIGKYKIKTSVDETPEDCRDWDNLGTMVCFHGRYSLGDKHEYKYEDYNGWKEMEKAIIKNENVAVILPIYLYDHSGITIKTTPFSCCWDSGQIGFIFVTKEKMKEEYGIKYVTKKWREKGIKMLIGEVKTYDQYLTGDVYGFEIHDTEGEIHKMIDSCWGYYGEDSCMEEAESIVTCLMS